MRYRARVGEYLDLLSRSSEIRQYENSLEGGAGHVPTELVEMFCSDIYHPRSPQFIAEFSEEELKDMARLYGFLHLASAENVSSVGELLKNPHWRAAITLAKELAPTYVSRPA